VAAGGAFSVHSIGKLIVSHGFFRIKWRFDTGRPGCRDSRRRYADPISARENPAAEAAPDRTTRNDQALQGSFSLE
jgi:hypothetical protein